MVDVCLPGTGGVVPLENRWLTCCWLEYQGGAVLIDCGEGTQIALKKAGCKLSRLDVLLITHYHADHIAGLPGLLLTLGNSGKTAPLKIIGPPGLIRVVSGLTVIAPELPYPVELMEIRENLPGEWEAAGLGISWLPLNHGIPCMGYRVTAERKPVFNPQKAKELDIPVTCYRTLHGGQAVELPDGRTIRPEQVLDGVREPIRVCYVTDTRPMEEMVPFARNADLLIGEGMYSDDAMREKMEEKGHMLFSDSARLARDSGAKRLWLTHYSPALVRPEEFLGNAAGIFANTTAAFDGIRITLPGREP